jgi:hypothetical protein
VLTIFPWIATIDKFQHGVYENPNHTLGEREENWRKILNEYTSIALDVSGLEEYRNIPGSVNCICMRFLFITLNMVLRN